MYNTVCSSKENFTHAYTSNTSNYTKCKFCIIGGVKTDEQEHGMLLAFDIGNSSISFGVANIVGDYPQFIAKSRIASSPHRTPDEYVVLIREILRLSDITYEQIDSLAVSSVVPQLTNAISEAASHFSKAKPLIVGPGIRTGLNIRVDSQTQVGADIVANAVAALCHTSAPAVIVDMGTATTISVVDTSSTLIGTIICPGLQVSLNALSFAASLISGSDFTRPAQIIGKNTHDSVNSGVINGHANMIDGFARDIRQMLIGTTDTKLSLLATGGLAEYVIPYCRNKFALVPDLTLYGVAEIYRRNQK